MARVSDQLACFRESDARVTESFVSGLAAVNTTDADAVPARPNDALNSLTVLPPTASDAHVHVIVLLLIVHPFGTEVNDAPFGIVTLATDVFAELGPKFVTPRVKVTGSPNL